jgi:small ubiquitin-related modifier
MADEKEKKIVPADPNTGNIITVKLVPQDGSGNLEIRAKTATKIERLINAYATQRKIVNSSVRLVFQGQRLRENQTLEEVNLGDGDQIDVLLEQVGGGW